MVRLYFENEYSGTDPGQPYGFSCEETARLVIEEVLRAEDCPYDAQVCLTLTDEETIRGINLETRGIDSATDVLSFPVYEFGIPGNFREAEEDRAGSFDPETGELLLGDIVISVPRMLKQAEEYGHSARREFAFLVAHSTLHLAGWDHMTEEEEKDMFARQEAALVKLGITRN